MIQGVGGGLPQQTYQPSAAQPRAAALEEPAQVSVDGASPFDIAQQIQEVQVENLKRTLDAQSLVLDLLA